MADISYLILASVAILRNPASPGPAGWTTLERFGIVAAVVSAMILLGGFGHGR